MDEIERRRYISELRESNSAASAALDREIAERAHTRPVESMMDRDRRELADFHRSLAQEREREAAKPARTPAATWDEIDRRCKAAAREAALAVAHEVADALKQERSVARRELADEVKSLRVELGALDETLGEVRRVIASSSPAAEIIDLPSRRTN